MTLYLDLADIAFDPDGRLHLVWDGNTSSAPDVHTAYQIFYAVRENGIWSLPINISQTSEYSFWPSLALDGAGRVHLIWMEGDSGLGQGDHIFDRILYQRKERGEWLTTPQQLSARNGVFFPHAATSTDGNVHLLWSGNTSANVSALLFRAHYSRWDGATLSQAVQISQERPNNGHSSPSIVLPASGTADPSQFWALWAGGAGDGKSQIFVSRHLASQLSLADVVSPANLADAPRLAGAGSTNLHAVWSQGVSPSRIAYSHWDGNGWQNATLISDPAADSMFPALDLSSSGTPHVAWYGHSTLTDDQVFYSRLTSSGWLDPLLISTDGRVAASPDLAVHTDDSVHMVWEEESLAGDSTFAILGLTCIWQAESASFDHLESRHFE